MPDWHVYLIRTRFGALYTGITTDVERRVAEHAQAGRGGAKYLRSKGPLVLVYEASIGSRMLALKVERSLKSLSKKDKERIVAARPDAGELLARLGISTTA